MVCGFNFEDRYGELGAGYIEAHHLTPFSELHGQPKKLNPSTDFIVVRPNCHRMLHRKSPPVPPEELKELIAVHRS
jgi:5-methylcytosine-specific restriction protein A